MTQFAKPVLMQKIDPDGISGGLPGAAERASVRGPAFAEMVDLRELLNSEKAVDQRRGMELLEKAYAIYDKCFPDPTEKESMDVLLGYLKDTEEMNWHMHVALDADGRVVAGRNSNVLSAETPKGQFDYAFGEHLFVEPDKREAGVGSALVKASNRAVGVGMVFSEQNDPFIMTPGEIATDCTGGIHPVQRLEFWGKQNYAALDAPYVQLSLMIDGVQQEPVSYLRPCAEVIHPDRIPGYDGKSMDRDVYLAALTAFFETFEGLDLSKDGPWAVLKRQIEQGPERLNFIPIADKRTFAQDRNAIDSAFVPGKAAE